MLKGEERFSDSVPSVMDDDSLLAQRREQIPCLPYDAGCLRSPFMIGGDSAATLDAAGISVSNGACLFVRFKTAAAS